MYLESKLPSGLLALLIALALCLLCSMTVLADDSDIAEMHQHGNVPLDIFQHMQDAGCKPIPDFYTERLSPGPPFLRFDSAGFVALCLSETGKENPKYKFILRVDEQHPFSSCPQAVELNHPPEFIGLANIMGISDPVFHKFHKDGDTDLYLRQAPDDVMLGFEIRGRGYRFPLTAYICVSGNWYWNASIYAD